MGSAELRLMTAVRRKAGTSRKHLKEGGPFMNGLDPNRDCTQCKGSLGFLYYKGRSGVYCSNKCFEVGEGHSRNKGHKESNMATTKRTAKKTRRTGKPAASTKKTKAAGTRKKKVKTSTPTRTKKVRSSTKPVAKSSKVDKAKKAKVSREDYLGGRYRPGSAVGEVFRVLSDGKTHKVKELHSVARKNGSKYPQDPLWYIDKHGRDSGDWELQRTGNNFREGEFTLVMDKKASSAAPPRKTKSKAKASPKRKKAEVEEEEEEEEETPRRGRKKGSSRKSALRRARKVKEPEPEPEEEEEDDEYEEVEEEEEEDDEYEEEKEDEEEEEDEYEEVLE